MTTTLTRHGTQKTSPPRLPRRVASLVDSSAAFFFYARLFGTEKLVLRNGARYRELECYLRKNTRFRLPEEWETRKKKEITTTRQIETRVKRQVVLEDGEVVVDSGPLVTTNTTEDVEQQEHTTQEVRVERYSLFLYIW